MVERLLRREETSAALELAPSRAGVAPVADGPGPVALGRMVSGALETDRLMSPVCADAS